MPALPCGEGSRRRAWRGVGYVLDAADVDEVWPGLPGARRRAAHPHNAIRSY
jgi:hypothetical protein